MTAAAGRAVGWGGRGAGSARPPGRRDARRRALTVPASHSRRTTAKGGDGVRRRSVWNKLFGLQRAVVEDVELTGRGATVVSVRPVARERDRCPRCRRRCPGYDRGEGRRRWRALDMGTTFAYLEAEALRVSCQRHGVIVAAVPWASRHESHREIWARADPRLVSIRLMNWSASAVISDGRSSG